MSSVPGARCPDARPGPQRRWQAIWATRNVSVTGPPRLADLIRADGYDNSFSQVSEDAWRANAARWATDLRITPGMSVYEIGCGAGAFLYVFREMGCQVGGLDLSERLIEIARAAMPGGDFRVGDAAAFTGSQRFDVLAALGVFLYFPSHRYARAVLAAMAKAARHAVLVGDLPDIRTAAQARASRVAALGEAEFARRYQGLDHLAFDRSDMAALLGSHGYSPVLVRDSAIPGYGNAAFRFDLAGLRAAA
jgi:trans-aconitate methyltransferase